MVGDSNIEGTRISAIMRLVSTLSNVGIRDQGEGLEQSENAKIELNFLVYGTDE